MGFSIFLSHLDLLLWTLLLSGGPPAAVDADIYSLIYKGCANGGVSAVSPPAVADLGSSLVVQASSSKFFKTTSSSGGQSLFGLFQCRGDLSPSDCASCVSRVVPLWSTLCGVTAAARVQLSGCYALYEIPGFPQVAGTQLLFKTCGGAGGGVGFEVKRDAAFSELENGIAGAIGLGFFATTYQSVYAMAQCEGDLSQSDCGNCVGQAVQESESECGGTASGQIYLDKCYISYSYYPNGVPADGGGGGGNPTGSSSGSISVPICPSSRSSFSFQNLCTFSDFDFKAVQQSGKTVAIVVGGVAGLGFLVICLLFARSLSKGKDDY